MSDARKVVMGASGAEYTEKKSRFIASCQGILNEKDALSLIDKERKRYYDARHTCYAYVCGSNNEITRFSDDGEPHGTAGKPILDVILGNNLKNCLITVTRYFGGTLLGTGGLVRAYSTSASDAVKRGIKIGTILETSRGCMIKITLDYKSTGKFEALCRKKNIEIKDKDFTEKAAYTVLIHEEETDGFIKEITDMTLGSAKIERGPVKDLIFNP